MAIDVLERNGGVSSAKAPANLSVALFGEAPGRKEVEIRRDEILDGRSRIVGYRFRPIATRDGAIQPSAAARLNALKEDRLANFAQHRMALVPISAEDWRAVDYRQFATPNTVFHVAVPTAADGAWTWQKALQEIKDSGAGIALDSGVLESSLVEALEFANMIFVRPADYSPHGLVRVIEALHSRHLDVAADGIVNWHGYRACLAVGIDYCLGEFTATPYAGDESHERAVVNDVLNCKLVQFSWYRVFECGQEDIDRDHRALFAQANDLLNAMISGKAERTSAAVDALLQSAADHFVREEAVLEAAGYSQTAQHAVLHRGLLEKAKRLVAEFKTGKIEIGPVFQFLADDLIVKHMLGADREFFPLLALSEKKRSVVLPAVATRLA